MTSSFSEYDRLQMEGVKLEMQHYLHEIEPSHPTEALPW